MLGHLGIVSATEVTVNDVGHLAINSRRNATEANVMGHLVQLR